LDDAFDVGWNRDVLLVYLEGFFGVYIRGLNFQISNDFCCLEKPKFKTGWKAHLQISNENLKNPIIFTLQARWGVVIFYVFKNGN
jgi:hypothetical protein